MPRCFETQVWDSCVTPCREVSYCPNNFSRVYVFLDFCEFSSCNQGMVWNGMERKFRNGIWKMPERREASHAEVTQAAAMKHNSTSLS